LNLIVDFTKWTFEFLQQNIDIFKALFVIFSTIFAAIITLILASIVIQQRKFLAVHYKLQAVQIKYMLYSPRLKFFNAVISFVSMMNDINEENVDDISEIYKLEFRRKTSEVFYIFGEEIQNYIKEIGYKSERLIYMIKYKKMLQYYPDDSEERVKYEKEIEELHAWFLAQDYEATVKFIPYLRIGS
jgi:hypothetical protein